MKQSKTILKSYFETGDRPTQEQFENLIDSLLHKDEGVAISSVTTHTTDGSLLISLSNGESFTITQVTLTEVNTLLAQLQSELAIVNQLTPLPNINTLNAGNTYALRIKEDGSGYTWEYVPPFNVLDLQPIAWLDAKDVLGTGESIDENTPINEWFDKSGNGNHAIPQGIGNEIPAYTATGLNELPSLHFGNTQLGMAIPFNPQFSFSWTYIFVCQQNAQTTGVYDGMYLADQNSEGRLLFNNGLPGTGALNFKIYQSGFKLNNDTGSADPSVCFFELDANSGTMNFYRSGVLMDTDTTYFGQDIGNDFTLGNRFLEGNANLFNGYISEVIIVPRVLDASEKTNTLKYINDKWRL